MKRERVIGWLGCGLSTTTSTWYPKGENFSPNGLGGHILGLSMHVSPKPICNHNKVNSITITLDKVKTPQGNSVELGRKTNKTETQDPVGEGLGLSSHSSLLWLNILIALFTRGRGL